MFWTEEKLTRRIAELEAYRYRDTRKIAPLHFRIDEQGEVGARPSDAGVWEEVVEGYRWEGRDLYAWIRTAIDVPEAWRGRRVTGRFDFGATGHGNNSGFESLLYVNEVPYQGVDQNHMEVFFPPESAGTTLTLQFRVWSGMGGLEARRIMEHRIRRAELCVLDESADDLYYTAKAALETIGLLASTDPVRVALLKALDRSFLKLDWSRPGDDAFYRSVDEARNTLRSELSAIHKHHPVSVHCIGHTHIDVAWLWRLAHTREKCARSFSTVLRLMELYPDYVFLQTQPQLYEYIKQDYPDIYEQIKERVKEGRWEAQGGMWLEADCNLTSGESLVRQLLLGTRFLRQEFGVECTYLWLPDVFGYSWALPQILRKSGFDTFMTTKISWSQYNRMPHDTFVWRGIDGSEILTHFITTPTISGEPFYTYNGKLNAEEVKGIWDNYRDKGLNQELLLSYGYGDGGGGVNRDMLELRRRYDELPGLPKVITSKAGDYFQKLHDTVAASDQYVHTWDGELYLEYHRGTYTSQAYSKRTNRKLELLYREAEWRSVMGCLSSDWGRYPQERLNEGWKIVLRNQFHDIIPGSSIREVYEDSREEYAQAEQIALEACSASSQDFLEPDDLRYTVLNSASWTRSDYAVIPMQTDRAKGYWVDDRGEALSAQYDGKAWLVHVRDLPSMGYGTVTFQPEGLEQECDSPFQWQEGGIVTPHYELAWNERGQLTRVYDRMADRDVLKRGERGNVLQVFEDKPKDYDAWDIDLFYQEKMREVDRLNAVRLVEHGQLRAIVRFEWTFGASAIVQDMTLYADSRRIDFRTRIDWQERQQLLKVAFPVDIRATEATYDIQFGNVKRPTHWNTSWDYARFETVGHQWADLSERGYGVSLLNDCKYGYDVKDHVLRLSLLRAPNMPDDTADRGMHEFTYALYPHQGDWAEGGTVQAAWSLNAPLSVADGTPSRSKRYSLFSVSGSRVFIDAVKKAEDEHRVVLRLHDYTGARGRIEITSDAGILSWQECDLMERPIGIRNGESILKTSVGPYEIKTFLVEFK